MAAKQPPPKGDNFRARAQADKGTCAYRPKVRTAEEETLRKQAGTAKGPAGPLGPHGYKVAPHEMKGFLHRGPSIGHRPFLFTFHGLCSAGLKVRACARVTDLCALTRTSGPGRDGQRLLFEWNGPQIVISARQIVKSCEQIMNPVRKWRKE